MNEEYEYIDLEDGECLYLEKGEYLYLEDGEYVIGYDNTEKDETLKKEEKLKLLTLKNNAWSKLIYGK